MSNTVLCEYKEELCFSQEQHFQVLQVFSVEEKIYFKLNKPLSLVVAVTQH